MNEIRQSNINKLNFSERFTQSAVLKLVNRGKWATLIAARWRGPSSIWSSILSNTADTIDHDSIDSRPPDRTVVSNEHDRTCRIVSRILMVFVSGKAILAVDSSFDTLLRDRSKILRCVASVMYSDVSRLWMFARSCTPSFANSGTEAEARHIILHCSALLKAWTIAPNR